MIIIMYNYLLYILKKMINKFKSQAIIFISIIYMSILSFVSAAPTPFPYDNWWSTSDKDPSSILKSTVAGSNSIWSQIMKAFFGDGLVNKSWSAMEYIRNIINIAISLVWFIALCMMIYGFLMIFFSKEEEWLKTAKSIVKWSVMAIVMIWLSWTIVSLLFWGVSVLRGA